MLICRFLLNVGKVSRIFCVVVVLRYVGGWCGFFWMMWCWIVLFDVVLRWLLMVCVLIWFGCVWCVFMWFGVVVSGLRWRISMWWNILFCCIVVVS